MMIGPKVALTGVLLVVVALCVGLIAKHDRSAYDRAVSLGAVSLWVVIIGAVITILEW